MLLAGAAMCAATFLPALGARTPAARRWLLRAGTAVSSVIGGLALAAWATSEGFWPSEVAWAFLAIAPPLAAAMAATGVVLLLTRPTELSGRVRTVLGCAAFLSVPTYILLLWYQ